MSQKSAHLSPTSLSTLLNKYRREELISTLTFHTQSDRKIVFLYPSGPCGQDRFRVVSQTTVEMNAWESQSDSSTLELAVTSQEHIDTSTNSIVRLWTGQTDDVRSHLKAGAHERLTFHQDRMLSGVCREMKPWLKSRSIFYLYYMANSNDGLLEAMFASANVHTAAIRFPVHSSSPSRVDRHLTKSINPLS